MKLLITGGGFVGRAIAREYPDMDITFMSRSHKEGKWIKGEVTGFEFPDLSFTHIIHAPLFMPPFTHYEITGFRRVQEFARYVGAKLLYVSSGVCGNPQDEYARAKADTEKLAAFDFIARPYAFIGPDLRSDIRVAPYAIMDFIKEALAHGTITVKGTGRNVRSWQWQGNMARELLAIMECGERGWPYHVGSWEAHTIKQGAEMVAKETGATVKVEGAKEGNAYYVPEYSRMLKGASGFVPLEEAIRKTIKCLQTTS